MLSLAYKEVLVQKIGPWNPKISCLEYAYDTIMILPPNITSIHRNKILIYIFKLLSGLLINFNKSSLYQLEPSSLDLTVVSSLLHWRMGNFPFTYLGLPLKPTSLFKTDWHSLLDRIDKRLASWKGHTLSREGRLILVNSILSSLLLYFISFFFIPQWVIDHIDRLRRAFF